MSDHEYHQLLELFKNKENTQLMKQSIKLLALKYLKVRELPLLHSYYHKTESKSENILFAAPAQLLKVEKGAAGMVELTIIALKDEFDAHAVSLVRALDKDEIEVTFSHLIPEFLTPKITKEGWDNWVFAYNLPFEEKLKRRHQRTVNKATALYKSLADYNFNGKKILFLGCGDGDEIATFITHFKLENAKITGIDQSAAAIENCRKIPLPGKNVSLTFSRTDLIDLPQLPNRSFDYLFALGLFDRETLSFADGQAFIKQIAASLHFETFITTGYSFDLFTSDDYRNLGFNVVASSTPETMYTHNANFYHALTRSGHEALPLEDEVAKESLLFFEAQP